MSATWVEEDEAEADAWAALASQEAPPKVHHHGFGHVRARREDEGWRERAACRNTDPLVFFPIDGEGVIAAQEFCWDCPVAKDCLDYALENHEDHGVWGGYSERGRRRLLRIRRSERR